MNEPHQPIKVSPKSVFGSFVISFLIIGLVRLILSPLALLVLLAIDDALKQPAAGILSSVSIVLVAAAIIIIIQNRYRTQLSASRLYGIWLAWIVQFGLSFIVLIIA